LEIQDDWYAFREQRLKEIAVEWREDHQIGYIDDSPAKNVNLGEKLKESPQKLRRGRTSETRTISPFQGPGV
jgi:hypothetical protein